jgi:Co/Zn/Cd efflux system component
MTYLQLINNVLIRLRETQVASNNETTYSSLIGLFINAFCFCSLK